MIKPLSSSIVVRNRGLYYRRYQPLVTKGRYDYYMEAEGQDTQHDRYLRQPLC